VKIVVTGGNGFIGQHIVKELASRGFEVISFDLVTPAEIVDGVKYLIGTVMDTFTMCKIFKGCDAVFHLAAILGVKRADSQLLRCLTINIEGTKNVLEAAVMSGVPYVFLTSSSEIFGDVNMEKVGEKDQFNPKSGYAISKLAAESYLKGFNAEYDLEFNIVRFFNIYGPGQVAEFVVPRFIKMAQNGIAPKIYGEGNQIRSFCHISDAARAAVDVFQDKRGRNETYNIGNDLEPITIRDLATKVIKTVGADLEPVFVPFEESDRKDSREIFFRIPEISKIKRFINYSPQIMLDEGLQDVMENGEIPESWVEPYEI
jgi:UDP-glucose 4-epimerase